MSFIRCGLSTTVNVCAAGDAFAPLDALDEFVFVGAEAQAAVIAKEIAKRTNLIFIKITPDKRRKPEQ